MSYLQLKGDVPAFSQAVVSLWFRVPAASVAACHATAGSSSPFEGVIPLLCLGPFGTDQPSTTPTTAAVACHTFFQFTSGGPVFTETDLGFTPTSFPTGTAEASGEELATLPTCIGVDCHDAGNPTLLINLQTGKKATIEKAAYNTVDLLPATSYAGTSNPGWPPGPNIPADIIYSDASAVTYDKTEIFAGSSEIAVTTDHWHHVLLSFFLNNVATTGNFPSSIAANTSSYSRMWLAFDDQNYTGWDLSDYWVEGSSNLNAVVTANAHEIAERSPQSGGDGFHNSTSPSDYGVFTYNNPPAGAATFSLTSPEIPIGHAGIPATTASLDNIFRVEQAELQLFTGAFLNTAIESNRRMFIKDNGKPELDYSAAETALGRPKVRLHQSGNWIAGKNTGSLGRDDDGKLITGGQFDRVALIRRYKPDPSLHGAQSPAVVP